MTQHALDLTSELLRGMRLSGVNYRRIETSRSGSAFAQNFVSDYQYDLLGQLTSDARFEGATPGAPDQKLEDESFAFLYDGIGNRLTARHAKRGRGTWRRISRQGGRTALALTFGR